MTDKCSITTTKGKREWWLLRKTAKGNVRYPDHIIVGELEDPLIYLPRRECNMKLHKNDYDGFAMLVCSNCGSGTFSSYNGGVNEIFFWVDNPSFCPKCGSVVHRCEGSTEVRGCK